MNTLDFVSLAVSRDEFRHNLTGVYRDTNKLVASDGHRLHWVEIPDGKPGYLDGRDAQFPDYSQVMPRDPASCVVEVKLAADSRKILKALAALSKAYDKTQTVTVKTNTKSLFIQSPEKSPVEFSYEIPCEHKKDTIKLGLSLRYLLDAMAPVIENKGKGDISIEFHGTLAPVLITCTVSGQEYKTIVMPTRF